LNSRDRVLATLDHEEPDFVPLTDHIYMPRSLEGVLGKSGVRVDTPREYVEVHRILGLDLIAAFPAAFPMTQAEDDTYLDSWGTRWRVVDGMPWYVEGTLKTSEDLENFVTPNPDDSRLYTPIKEIVKLVGGELAIGGVVEGPFTRSWIPMGIQTFIKMLYTNRNVIERFIEKVTDFLIEMGKNQIDIGVDAIWIPDDMGYVHGLMMSPKLFREFIIPHLKRMIDAFKRRGVKVLMHNDGQIMAIMDDLIDAGIDAIHPLERAAGMSLEVMKKKYGDEITLIGNVDSKTVLQRGSFHQIKEQVLECLRTASPGGGYILASDHSVHEGIPSDNIKYMFKIARRYGKYPDVTMV